MSAVMSADKYKLALTKFNQDDFESAEELLESLYFNNPVDFNTNYFLAVVKSKLGKYSEAIELYDKILKIDPDHTEAHFNKALCHQHLGQEKEAIFHYSRAIELNPLLNDAHNNIAVIYKERGDMRSVEEHVTKIFENKYEGFTAALQSELAKIQPEQIKVKQIKKAVVLHNQKKYEESIKILEELNAEKSDIPEVLYLMGNTYFHINRIDDALTCFEKCAALEPENATAYYSMAFCYKEKGELQKAENYYRKALEIKPDYPDALNNLGLIYYGKGEYSTAIEYFEKAVEKNPQYVKAIVNIGSSKTFLDEFDEALTYFDLAEKIVKSESNDELLSLIKANKGFCYLRANNLEKALGFFNESIELNPGNVLSHYNKAETLLKMGDFKNGWLEYEWRKKREEFGKRKFFRPLEKGVNVENKRIFVYAEQGFGDAIHFVRYLKLLKELGAHIILECSVELKELFLTTGYIDEIIEKNPALEKRSDIDYDYDVALLSLPLYFNTELTTIPDDIPYLKVKKEKIEYWRNIVKSPKLKIGLVWGGSPGHKNDKNRSIPLKDFQFLFDIEGVEYFSLQKGKPKEQLKEFAAIIKDMDEYGIENFEDTAAIIENLDLVITVDTSVAHLAGALGKETWVLLPLNSDWRWLMDRNDSPWYPTLRLFRQSKIGEWEQVFVDLKNQLLNRLKPLNENESANIEVEKVKTTNKHFKLFLQPFENKEDKSFVEELTVGLIENIFTQLNFQANPELLDLNCGEGEVLGIFGEHGFRVYGATNNREHYEVCKNKNLNVQLTDYERIDFPTEKFDLIFARNFLEKSPAPYYLFDEIKRLLKPEGIAYFEIAAPATPALHEKEKDNYSLFTKKVWEALFEKAEFELITADTIEIDMKNGSTDLHYYFLVKGKKTLTKVGNHKKESKTGTLTLALTEGENFGWGVCSKYLNIELSKKINVINLLKNNKIGEKLKVEGKVFHALKNEDFLPLHNVWGDENYGYTFFEYELNKKAIYNAPGYDLIFAGSTWCKNKMEQSGIKNTAILIQGVDTERFYPGNKKSNRDLFVIFSGGKFELRKGQDLVLKAVKILQQKYPDVVLVASWFNMWPQTMESMKLSRHIEFELRGNNWEEQFNHLIRKNGLNPEKIIPLPLVDNNKLREIYINTDIGLFPNRCEGGTNLVLMEYMACGKPVIASYNSGHTDVLTEENSICLKDMNEFKITGENGELIADWSEPELEEILSKLEWAYWNREKIKQIGENAAEFMLNFTWEKSAESLISQIFKNENNF